MPANTRSDLFDFVIERIRDTARAKSLRDWQAFPRWFIQMYYLNPTDIFHSDGSKDGKIDLFFSTINDGKLKHHIVNSKFTAKFNQTAPPAFYEEIQYFHRVFENQPQRAAFLEKAVAAELRPHYKKLFKAYDEGNAELLFLTNYAKNEGRLAQIDESAIRVIHLDDVLHCIVDDIDGAMPRTKTIELERVSSPLTPDLDGMNVATSIVFARLIDFLRYMESDPYDLLFMRNVRTYLGNNPVNKAIRETFRTSPEEFAYSHNGITMLCDKQHHDPGSRVLQLENPRVVNGSQTLHSIRDVPNPSTTARVMVRIITVPPPSGPDIGSRSDERKAIINNIAVRSNQQNPIKKWDLVSNDDFQMELFRHFRQREFFYERRNKEWQQRQKQLKGDGIAKGTSIRQLTQWMACYYWQKKGLGPASARQPGQLFEGNAYQEIRKTPLEVAFQIFAVGDNIDKANRVVVKKVGAAKLVKPYHEQLLLSRVVRAMDAAGFDWGSEAATTQLLAQWSAWYGTNDRPWIRFVSALVKEIVTGFRKEAATHKKRTGENLTPANFFKSQEGVSTILRKPVPLEIRRLAKKALAA